MTFALGNQMSLYSLDGERGITFRQPDKPNWPNKPDRGNQMSLYYTMIYYTILYYYTIYYDLYKKQDGKTNHLFYD